MNYLFSFTPRESQKLFTFIPLLLTGLQVQLFIFQPKFLWTSTQLKLFKRNISEQNGQNTYAQTFKRARRGGHYKLLGVFFTGRPVLLTDGNPLQTRPVRSDAQ